MNPSGFYTKDNVHLLAIDVDDKLIEVAKAKMEEDEGSGCAKENISFVALDVMKLNEADNTFKTYLERLSKTRFDIIFCFSVTMWIHLNHGDQGLKQFLQSTKKWCNYLVLEPQPWKCYRTASRRMRKANKPDFAHLEKIESKCEKLYPFILEECEKVGFKNVANFGETGWKRQIMLFKACDAKQMTPNNISDSGNPMAAEIAKIRQYILNSLEFVDGLLVNPLHMEELVKIKISRLELENENLKKATSSLRNALVNLENRVLQLETGVGKGHYRQ